MVLVSAPGKVHLIGEHAVVYGYPAIIASVGRRIYVDAQKSNRVILKDCRWNSRREWHIQECLDAAAKSHELLLQCEKIGNYSELINWAKDGGSFNIYWKAMLGIVLKMIGADGGISIDIVKSEIPTGSGIGSSSASAVAIAKAAAEVYGKHLSLEKINEIAFECERLVHGNPSGGDNTACCFGGLVWFERSSPLNIVTPLKGEISQKFEGFVFVNTQRKKTSGELIQIVRDIPEKKRVPKMEELGKMAMQMKQALKSSDMESMKKIINRTNDILASFGLSVPETDEICRKAVSLGGAAKMCGACGGGIVMAWHKESGILVDAIRDMGYEPYRADIGVEGVRVEKT